MLWWTLAFMAIAAVSGVLGFVVLAGASAGLAQTLCYAFAAMAVVCGGFGLFDMRHTV